MLICFAELLEMRIVMDIQPISTTRRFVNIY